MRRNPLLCMLLVLAVAAAAPVAAEIYTLTLDNGTVFETRYAPLEDPTNPDNVQFLTDTGNWITLPLAMVESMTTDTELYGFGRVIAANTIELGMSFNDLPNPDETGAPADSSQALLEYLQSQPQRDYSVQQFVEPEEAGRGGLPVTYAVQPR
jgi:hypothetical protein